jgi:hypothetical protein
MSQQTNPLLAKLKPEIERTFEIRVNSNADKKFLYKFIRKYKHWQNIITIMVTDLFKKNSSDYRYFVTIQPHQQQRKVTPL